MLDCPTSLYFSSCKYSLSVEGTIELGVAGWVSLIENMAAIAFSTEPGVIRWRQFHQETTLSKQEVDDIEWWACPATLEVYTRKHREIKIMKWPSLSNCRIFGKKWASFRLTFSLIRPRSHYFPFSPSDARMALNILSTFRILRRV